MKKAIAILILLSLAVLLLPCCEGENGGRIAVVQQLDHASMDEIRLAITDRLEEEKIPYKLFNGQNDATNLNQIGAQIVSGGYCAIIPIGTLAAQCVANAAQDTDIPVIFAAVSDPESAGLTAIKNVTGTSDALNTSFILDMMLAVNPDVKTVGLLYSNSEPNSETPVAQAKEYLKSKGISCLEKTGNTAGEILDAVNAMVGRVDAVFTPTDNVVMASESAISEILNNAKIPHYAGADSFIQLGAFATCGVSYKELGRYTGQMAVDILKTGNIPRFHVMGGDLITVNSKTSAALGIDYSIFKTMVRNVQTIGN